jgi:hypothetical protein
MSERGVSVGDSPAAAEHVATPQWQSFEHRMRQRRADRCIQHASAAVELGHFDEAREALAEAHGLDPLHPGLQELSLRIDILTAPPPPPPSPQVGSGAPLRLAAVACLALLMSGLAGWVAWREWPQSGLPEAETATDVYLPRDVSTDGTPSPAPADVAATGQTVAPPSAEPVPEPPSVAANPPQSAAVGSSAAPPPGASEPVATAGPEERTARADDRRATPLPIPPRATTEATETPARREEPPPTAPPPRAAPPATVNAVPAAPLATPGVSTFPTPGVTPAAPPGTPAAGTRTACGGSKSRPGRSGSAGTDSRRRARRRTSRPRPLRGRLQRARYRGSDQRLADGRPSLARARLRQPVSPARYAEYLRSRGHGPDCSRQLHRPCDVDAEGGRRHPDAGAPMDVRSAPRRERVANRQSR